MQRITFLFVVLAGLFGTVQSVPAQPATGNFPYVYLNIPNKDEPEVYRTNVVPLWPDKACFGWTMAVEGGNRSVELTEVLTLSSPSTNWGHGPETVVENGDKATTKITVDVVDNRIARAWCIVKGDPVGQYRYNIFIDGQHRAEFIYCAVNVPDDGSVRIDELKCPFKFDSVEAPISAPAVRVAGQKALTMAGQRPAVLCILDGWGHRDVLSEDNAIAAAHTMHINRLEQQGPMALIDASEHYVGLPDGQMGNSEVGHMNIGAGRVVMQDLPRIDTAIADGSLARNPRLIAFIDSLKRSNGTCHLMGLLSPGGVHSHQHHLAALAHIVAASGVPVRVHGFLDGRDTPPSSALEYLRTFATATSAQPQIRLGTVSGRYYAMDRDKRWDRVTKAYDAMVLAEGKRAPDGDTAVAQSYTAGATDEFVLPTVIGDYAGMNDGDGVLMGNFRADRAREILTALLDPLFDGFARRKLVRFAAAAGMVEYSTALNPFITTLFPPEVVRQSLGEVVAKAGLKQLRIAETEKYAHVTFFFNGGEELVFEGEDRILVPSPKVATYDMKPEMSAPEVTDRLVAAIDSGKYDLIVVNYANGDMVGHTGDMKAAVKAVEAVDICLGRLDEAVRRAGGVMLITADHGNVETMHDNLTGQAFTAHTLNRVPAILVNAPANVQALRDGKLADIAPTMLALMGLPQPAEMTGQSLLQDHAAVQAKRA